MAGIGAVGATAIGVIAAGAEIDGLDAIATVDGVVVAAARDRVHAGAEGDYVRGPRP